ncbi:hypothetical protein YC2023_009106 [Brassica napus]
MNVSHVIKALLKLYRAWAQAHVNNLYGLVKEEREKKFDFSKDEGFSLIHFVSTNNTREIILFSKIVYFQFAIRSDRHFDMFLRVSLISQEIIKYSIQRHRGSCFLTEDNVARKAKALTFVEALS